MVETIDEDVDIRPGHRTNCQIGKPEFIKNLAAQNILICDNFRLTIRKTQIGNSL